MIDLTKKYKTRGGDEVFGIIHCPQNPRCSRLLGFIRNTTTDAVGACSWLEGGDYIEEDTSLRDLVEVKPGIRRTYWVNIYQDQGDRPYSTREEADRKACITRLACVKIEIDCEEGEGL